MKNTDMHSMKTQVDKRHGHHFIWNLWSEAGRCCRPGQVSEVAVVSCHTFLLLSSEICVLICPVVLKPMT